MPRWPKKNERDNVDEYGRKALWEASFKGDIDKVESLIREGEDPNIGDDLGFTPLHIAIQEKHYDVVDLLLVCKADPNQQDKNGNVPLWTAIGNWDKTNQIILRLLKAGADPTISNNVGNNPYEALTTIEGEVKAFVVENFGV